MLSGKTEEAGAPQAGQRARVFAGIKIAPETANQLAQFAASLDRQFARPVAPADIHLTLVPPWNEASIPDAIAKLCNITGNFGKFWLMFRHVGYGPQARRPRLLWVDCTVSNECFALRTALLDTFQQIDERPFRPHVTLARIRTGGPAIARKYPIDQPLSLAQRVESVELFQSPPPGDSGYRILISSKLGQVAR
jgi:2'-5' RNA ligase